MTRSLEICQAIVAILAITLVAMTTYLSVEIREKNFAIDELNADVAFGIEQATELQTSLDSLTSEHEVTVTKNAELGEEVTSANANASAQTAEASKQKDIAWNAQAERNQIAQEKAELDASWDKLVVVTANYSLASDHYEEVVRYVDLALDYANVDNYAWANYMIDLAADENALAQFYSNLAQVQIDAM